MFCSKLPLPQLEITTMYFGITFLCIFSVIKLIFYDNSGLHKKLLRETKENAFSYLPLFTHTYAVFSSLSASSNTMSRKYVLCFHWVFTFHIFLLLIFRPASVYVICGCIHEILSLNTIESEHPTMLATLANI